MLDIEAVPGPSLDPALPVNVTWAFSLAYQYPGILGLFIQGKQGFQEKQL